MQYQIDGATIQIDEQDIQIAYSMKWKLDEKGYVCSYTHDHKLQIHREILQITDSNILVDHINGDKLDNRRCNLRTCTNQQNCFNTNGKFKYGKKPSKHKGVYWNSACKGWRSGICINRRVLDLYASDDQDLCGYAYNVAAEYLHKEFAYLNKNVKESEEVKQFVINKLKTKYKL